MTSRRNPWLLPPTESVEEDAAAHEPLQELTFDARPALARAGQTANRVAASHAFDD